jgi:hypothetical protein
MNTIDIFAIREIIKSYLQYSFDETTVMLKEADSNANSFLILRGRKLQKTFELRYSYDEHFDLYGKRRIDKSSFRQKRGNK